jgi:hypothetical protein
LEITCVNWRSYIPTQVKTCNWPDSVNQADYNHAMPEESPSRRIRKIREDSQRKLRVLRVQLGETLLKSRGAALPEAQTDRERIAQIEAYKNLIRDKTRELESWIQHRDSAAKRGMTKQAQFRQQMITGMESQVERYKEELRRLQSIPGSSWSGST